MGFIRASRTTTAASPVDLYLLQLPIFVHVHVKLSCNSDAFATFIYELPHMATKNAAVLCCMVLQVVYLIPAYADLRTTLLLLRDTFDFKPHRVLDIGANRGEWSSEVRQYFTDAEFLMIEGNPGMEPNLRKTGIVYEIAILGAKAGQVQWYENVNADTGNSIYRERTTHFHNADTVVSAKQMITLDMLIERRGGHASYQFVKLDTQGAEVDIMRGGRNIMKHAEVVFVETSTIEYNEGAVKTGQVIAFMGHIGFDLFTVVDVRYGLQQMPFQLDMLFVQRSSPIWTKLEKTILVPKKMI